MFSPWERRAASVIALASSMLFTSACAIDLDQARLAGKSGVEVFSSLSDSFDTGTAMVADRRLVGELRKQLDDTTPPPPEALDKIEAVLAAHGELMSALAGAFIAFHDLAAFDDASEIGLRFEELRSASDNLATLLDKAPWPQEQVAIVEAGVRLLARWFQASRVAQENERLIVLTTQARDLLQNNRDAYLRLIDEYYEARKKLVSTLESGARQNAPALELDAALLAEYNRLELPIDAPTLRTYFGADAAAQEKGAREWVAKRLREANDEEKTLALAQVDSACLAVEKLLEAERALAESKSIDIKGIVDLIEQVRALRDSTSDSGESRSGRGDWRSRSERPRGNRRHVPRNSPPSHQPTPEGDRR